MDIPNKLRIIDELIDGVKVSIIKKVRVMPEEWDGIELRWYVAEMFKEMIVDPTTRHEYKKRYKEYRNTVIVAGL